LKLEHPPNTSLKAEKKVKDLQNKLLSLETVDLQDPDGEGKLKEIRVWMDGAFDMMHFGHMNAFRQGRSLGTRLIAGINSDDTITACKGPPVCSERERIDTVRGCKWVDEVVEGVPYVMNDDYLNYIIDKYKIDYIVHGDDPCIVDGKNVYETAIKKGKSSNFFIFEGS
jgi:ethanolamine-phosphate cytidylyltransferase